MDLIVEMRFGSHLYGTATPASDLDLKGVFLPEPRDILLQRVRGAVSSVLSRGFGEKAAPGEIEREAYSLQRYLELLAEGQPVALDMLFAPAEAMTQPPSSLWTELRDQSHLFVTKRATAFVRYCRQQANKYGIKGSRVAAARRALALLSEAEATRGTTARLAEIAADLKRFSAETEHVALVDTVLASGQTVRHLDVCGRRMPFTASVKNAREIAQRLVDEYGQRALQAERQEGVDWKALSHAVRVGREALELLTTGRITLPLPYASHILRIKGGELPYGAVAEEIESLLAAIEAAAATSTLREEPDRAAMDDLVCRAYRAKILAVPP